MDDRRWIPYLARVFALAGLYFAGAKLGHAFSLTWSRARVAEVIALMLTLVLICGVVIGFSKAGISSPPLWFSHCYSGRRYAWACAARLWLLY